MINNISSIFLNFDVFSISKLGIDKSLNSASKIMPVKPKPPIVEKNRSLLRLRLHSIILLFELKSLCLLKSLRRF